MRREARPQDEAGWGRPAAAARAADPDSRRDELRRLWAEADPRAQLGPLRDLAAQADVATWSAPTLLLLARALESAGDPDAASALLRRAVVPHPGDVGINEQLAYLLERSRPPRRDEAIRYYTAARALRPETAAGLAEALLARGDTVEAIAILRDLIRLRPSNLNHPIRLSVALRFQAGRPEEGLAVLDATAAAAREAVRLRPDDATARAVLGRALTSQGKFDEAAAELRRVVPLKPQSAGGHVNLGIALGRQGKFAEAEAALREAIRLRPEVGMIHYSLGNVLLREGGKDDEALAELREALRLGAEPALGMAHFSIGVALARQGKLGEAEAAYREATRVKPDFSEAHSYLGTVLKRLGKPAEAESELRAAIRLEPGDLEARFRLDEVLLAQGKPAEAEAALREAIRLRPDDADAHAVLGSALMSQGKFDEAAAEMREVVRLKPNDAKAHSQLAFTRRESGDLDAAMRSVGDALRLDPELGIAQSILAKLLVLRGRFSEAVPALERAATRLNATGLRDPAATAEALAPAPDGWPGRPPHWRPWPHPPRRAGGRRPRSTWRPAPASGAGRRWRRGCTRRR